MICSQLDVKYYDNFQLSNYNTLRINSIAKSFFLPDNTGELITIIKKYKNQNPIILGNGSNVLFSSKGVIEPLIHTSRINSINCSGQNIEVEAGVKTGYLSKFALDKGLSGFEFLIGIPATLGGAVYMNAGAHNQTISDKLISVKVYDIDNNKTITLKKEELNFSYRHSILQEKNYVLLSAKFCLDNKEKETIKAKMDENLIFRKNRQPKLSTPNAGSVFKNPSDCGFSAGALIDKCGFRGYSKGDCEVYQNHCNFIINKGSATSLDYTNLVFEIYSKVKKEFNVELTPEIIYIGKKSKDEEEKWRILKN